MVRYTGYALSVNGTIFKHPMDGSAAARDAHQWAKMNGEYPYCHLYEGDNVADALYVLKNSRS